MTREALYAEAMRLPVEERRALALQLLEHQDDDEIDPDIEAAWDLELQRRRKLLDEGKLKLYAWEQVRAELYAEDGDEDASEVTDPAHNSPAPVSTRHAAR